MGDRNNDGPLEVTKKEQAALSLMRIKVEALDPASKGIDDATLLRFLYARSLNVEKSTKFFIQHQLWRRSFVPLGYIPEEGIAQELKKERIFLQGHDKQGRAIGVLLASRHFDFSHDVEDLKRYVVYAFDKAIVSTKNRQGNFLIIIDLADLRLKNIDIRGILACLNILQDHYPERLGKLFVIHVPYIFWGAWRMIYPFIDEMTRKKILFVDDKNLQVTLLKEISQDQLPDLYGGLLPLVPIHLSAVPNWPHRNT
eukprot:c21923_g1_i1 orf=840-1604(+)